MATLMRNCWHYRLHKRRVPKIFSLKFGDVVLDLTKDMPFCKDCIRPLKRAIPALPMRSLCNGLFGGRECPLFRQPRRTLGKTLALRLGRALVQQVYLSGKGPLREHQVSDQWKEVLQKGLVGNTIFYAQANMQAEKLKIPLSSAADGLSCGSFLAMLQARCD